MTDPSNHRHPRTETAERVADMLKELASVEDATTEEIAEAMGIKIGYAYKWVDAFLEVGIIEEAGRRRKSPEARGYPAATYKLAKWVKDKVS